MHWLALLVFCGNQTYSYNIRGWLKTLGSSLTDGYTQTNYYQESGATAPRFNGNISRIDWGGKAGSGGTFKTRTYNYIYDHANRLKTANFTASGEANRFNVTGITYDANGNIYSMERRNQRATSDYNVVDDLEYSYNRFSNRLSQVKVNNLSTNYTAKDFKDRGTAAYSYDENGNMTANVDKEITLITYNHLNLPQEITFESGAQLRFAYDATGAKLTQKVYNSSGTLTKTQDYIGEIVLLDGALDYLIHEEGRLVAEVDGLWGEYYLKDHLGNIRQVLRAPTSQSFMATMETQNAEAEEMAFSMVSESRQTEPAHNVTEGGNQVAWLNANRGRMVGPGRTQEIYAGDSLKLQVHGKYLEDKNQKANAASFMAAGGKERLVADLNELALSNQRAGGANPIALLNLADILAKDLMKKEAPEAYLMYALYDQDSNRYEVGKKVLSKNAANQHEVLEEEMYISKDGYMQTFVVNETSEDVWFDNMMVMSVSSVIVQETHYDPWGLELTGLGYQYGGIKANKYLYNGKELIENNGLQYYDYGARMYDATIGRWGVVDPMADLREWVSPYNFVQNNPLNRIDPDGAFDWVINEDTKEYVWMNEVKSQEDISDDNHRYVGASIQDVINDFSKDLPWYDVFSNADINFNSWPGELSGFEPNAAGNLKEKIGDMPFPISTVGNTLYETVDNAYVSTFQLGGNRTNLEGFGVGRGEVTDAGVNTMLTVIPYSKVARVSGLGASQFSSMLKGTNVNKILYRAGHQVRGWANKAFNYVYSRQVDYSIKAASGGAKAIEKKDKN